MWVLTETSSAMSLGDDYTAVESYPLHEYHRADESLVTIWSRWRVYRHIPTFDPAFAACAAVESPFGAMVVYGTVIPYANDKGLSGTAKRWEEHRKSIHRHYEDWSRIKGKYPNHLFCIAGDFNQSRDGSGWYEDVESVGMLTHALQNLSLKYVTEDKRANVQSRVSVDHICLSKELTQYIMDIGAWEGETMSDHNGVSVELKCAAV